VGRACGSAARERRDAENRAEEKVQEKSARAKRGWVLARPLLELAIGYRLSTGSTVDVRVDA
jgi:hypothetical protein